MPLPYDFTAGRLSKAGLDSQLSHCGMIEFQINTLLGDNAKDVLMVGLSSFTLPTPRKMKKATIHYLNGAISVPTKVGAVGDLQIVINDYINGRQREVLHKLFDLVYDERTGLSRLTSQMKFNAYVVLFGQDGITRAEYMLYGLFLLNDPSLPNIKFSDSGIVDMTMDFSVDTIDDEHVGSGAGSLIYGATP